MELLSTQSEAVEHRVEDRRRNDLETYFAELVDGSMRNDFEMRFTGSDYISEDGRSLDKTTKDGQNDARKLAKKVPELEFEVPRRNHERDEFHESVEMALGQRPNTIISVSDFPLQLQDAKHDVGGYNVTRKQTMLRVLALQPDGNVRMYSQTLDRSDRQALEAIYARFGIQPEPGELLGQRINVDLTPDQQVVLTDELTGIYDRTLESKYGGKWHAGRSPGDIRNTYDFVCQQTDLINECIRLDNLGWLNEKFMYGVAAEMNRRFKGDSRQDNPGYVGFDPSDPALLHLLIEQAGAEASRRGVSFSACGVTLNAEADNQFAQAGYGNRTDRDCEFISKQCPECGAKNVKTKVTKDKITGSCGCSKSK